MKIVCVIPARAESSRFFEKPLALILGKPMIQWVYEHCKEVEEFDEKFKGILSDHAQSLVDVYLSYPYKWSSKIKLIFSKEFGYKIPTFKEKSLHVIHVLRNKL